ncbi:vacuolar protein sorting-associated protein 72 homolog [Haliotis rufescens]|uniref:vacuolar protein sorting-associated protein 72 homolog n=1 Tax=Haliotis rufescens TaxID=6454 RepID=UPI001EB02812|nr:vacuolar protein sorting-associated protein 72 homolog [Haliotis rufescens]
MAATREKRSNAGAKMARLLDDEEEDDFYKTTYGGFTEEVEDNDYQSENSESEATDSDIDIDEDDEARSDLDDDEPLRKKRGVDTKAYKEPVKKDASERKPAERKKHKAKSEISSVQIYSSNERKSLRHSTAVKSQATAKREQEREQKNKMMKEIAAKKNVTSVRRLTQDELLAEAKITEQLNLKSLETYERLESEKKKVRVTKQAYRGPIIRYQSLAMPVVEEVVTEPDINVDEDSSDAHRKTDVVRTGERCERTFITFTDEGTYKDVFPQKRSRPPAKQLCPITRQPAKYYDPITQTPYSTLQAFRCIRDAYSQQLEGQRALQQKKREKTPVPSTSQTVTVTS